MSLQVGPHCYATALDAGAPACAAFVPVSSLSGNQLTTISCSSVRTDGSLLMVRSVADTTGATNPVLTEFIQQPSYPPCVEADYLTAVEGIVGPILGTLMLCWGLWRVASYLGWGRHTES